MNKRWAFEKLGSLTTALTGSVIIRLEGRAEITKIDHSRGQCAPGGLLQGSSEDMQCFANP
jgi:hypothetical protein